MRNHLSMIDTPYFEDIIRQIEKENELPSLGDWRAAFSSPRLMDVCITEKFNREHFFLDPCVAYSFLDQHTMLADDRQPTWALSLQVWEIVKPVAKVVTNPHFQAPFINIQVWPFDVSKLTMRQRVVAVAISFTGYELCDPRVAQAVNEVAAKFNLKLKPLE